MTASLHHDPADKKMPMITVIVAVRNKGRAIERCLSSVAGQTHPSKEIIVMDGASIDETPLVLRSWSEKISYYESMPDRGIYHAWNKALNHARGDWICFLGADDYLWNNRVLEDLVPYLTAAALGGIRVVYGRVARVDPNGKILKRMGKPWEDISWLMPHGMPLPHTGLMHHRSLFEQHGFFDETFQVAGDYELLLRELKAGRALFAADVLTAGWQAGGISEFRFLLGHREMAVARKKHGFGRFSGIWAAVHARGIVRHYWRVFRRYTNPSVFI